MALHYHCRHCGTKIGTLQKQTLNTEQLGFNHLNNEDRQDMIVYDSAGDIHVKAICEDCHESLQRNPDLHQNDYIIH
ncbi:anti-sigma-F factor Fin family protein [Bacillus sp. CECT 9360]|uniref:anti-sigma-F factor Fin family protein n=1 Tax=Bacillus sp. CECT 9360 TaxID=2845821 RepID=UPI001E56D483|nr:anti-sigma-F factor Fin family protein [Bacillus sp. CECT 9360]CAH0347582.1 Anti-sigma-F factor Fin [Bacillus sp. CECT 9360]